MNVAFFVQYCHPTGTYFRWHNLAVALTQVGVKVDVYAGDFDYKSKRRIEKRDGVAYYITPSLITCRLFTNPSDPFSALRRLLNPPQKKYDVYHLFQPFLQAYVPWIRLKKKVNALFIYDWDDLWTGGLFGEPNNLKEKYVHRLVKKLESKLPSASHGVTVCSSFLMEKIAPPTLVEILHNGFWLKTDIEKNEAREKWKLHGPYFYMAYVGRTANELSWIKHAVDRIEEYFSDVRLIIAGPSPQALEGAGLLNHPKVDYFGEVSPLEASEIAAASDLGLIPLEDTAFNQSRFPIKFFDFLSVGTPVYFSGVGEICKIGKNISLAFEGPSDSAGWGSGLKDVLHQVRQSHSVVEVKELVERYAWPALGEQLVQFYTDLTNGKKR